MNSGSGRYKFAIPLDANVPISAEQFNKLVPNPAKKYPFELDTFQKQAIIHIEKGENVFVAAHTSAGKTVVAEYAIALAFANKTQVIYTSPIKALSNQKFRDLRHEFKNVGIITGDVQLNSEAPCLVMTTEILLQMLYASSETLNHLEFVIFDECHYVNDTKRGHVWEEVFILLPSTVKLVLLSATVPNVIEFSDWLGRTRQRQIYVISTTRRPVPLKHYLYLGRDGKTQNQQILILDGDGPINKTNHELATDLMDQRKAKFGFIKRTPQTERNIYLNLIRHLQKNDKLPVICFTLSRRKCDQNLAMLLSIKEENSTLTNKRESFYIKRFIYKHLKNLDKTDFELEQVKRVSTMLVRGFGVHHSGILPILKELTEILFSTGLVKVLFATETFAMGVNMPARTVVFDSLNKHDGICRRFLRPAEYIQMAGRAGRRGKDTEGTVIIVAKYEVPSLVELNLVMKGSAQLLESQFRLTYHMILNMLKSQASSIEEFLERSYREHNKVLASSSVESGIQQLTLKMNELVELSCEKCSTDINEWFEHFKTFKEYKRSLMNKIILRASDRKLLNSGRIIVFEDTDQIVRAGLLIKSLKSANAINELVILFAGEKDDLEVKSIPVQEVICLLNKQVKGIDSGEINIENEKSKSSFGRNKRKFATEDAGQKLNDLNLPANFQLLVYVADNFIGHDKLGKLDPDTIMLLQEYGRALKSVSKGHYACIRCEQFLAHYHIYRARAEMQDSLEQLDFKLSNESLELLPEYRQRTEVLKDYHFLDEHLVLQPKGHIASCLSESELIITEVVFENLLGNLSDEAIPAVLSCFIFDSKRADQSVESTQHIQEIEELDNIIKKIVQICIKFGRAENERGIEDNDTHYLDQLNLDPVRAVYEWAKGQHFADIMKYTGLQEGIMVRCIQRVDELIKNVRIASRNLDLVDFQTKLERSSKLIRRDIVFMPSLYTTRDMVDVIDHDNDNKQQNTFIQQDVVDGQIVNIEPNDYTDDDDDDDEIDLGNDFFSYRFDDTKFIENPEALNEENFSANFL
ncbi:superkiller complex protein 2 [Dermatophagoides farinae]|uniref:superkiller complex protein 2 n=1 Tax=Dermatophagoides farinae TaxID=6954 RepID=UPI003F63D5F0